MLSDFVDKLDLIVGCNVIYFKYVANIPCEM